jgi:hypothetical protein
VEWYFWVLLVLAILVVLAAGFLAVQARRRRGRVVVVRDEGLRTDRPR